MNSYKLKDDDIDTVYKTDTNGFITAIINTAETVEVNQNLNKISLV